MLSLVPKGRRIVTRGGASDSCHTRNPGEAEEVIPAPEWATEPLFNQSIGQSFRRPYRALRRGLLEPRVPLRFTLGYGSVALSRAEGRSQKVFWSFATVLHAPGRTQVHENGVLCLQVLAMDEGRISVMP